MTPANNPSRVYRIEKFGAGIDGLVAGVAPVPSAGPGEVLVRVRATALNFRDLAILDGKYIVPAPSGRIPLPDAAGEASTASSMWAERARSG